MSPHRTVTALGDHDIPSRAPIDLDAGERVQVGRRDTTWPAFVFVSTSTGEGWVPERHLDAGRPWAIVRTAYTTRELAVTSGSRLVVLEDDRDSGWAHCRDETGRTGWVPYEVLDERASDA